jgi:multiple sugar transport system permease protein
MENLGENSIGLFDLPWKRRPGLAIKTIVILIVLAVGSFVFLLPLFWMLATSLKSQPEVYVFPPQFFPETWNWGNFIEGWTYPKTQFPLWLGNTLFITLMVTMGTILTSSLCAFGFATIKFPGRNFWFMVVLGSVMLPGVVTLIPLYILYNKMKWLDTFYPLWVPTFFGGGAFNIFFMRQFFMSLPKDLEEAAIMDGASRLRVWWQIFLPLSKPILATVAVWCFQGSWNNFYGPLIFISSPSKYTLALGVNSFKGLYATQIPLTMAMSFLMVIPMIIVFFLAQRHMIRGVIMSGIKA